MWWLLLAACVFFRPDVDTGEKDWVNGGPCDSSVPCPCEVDVDEDGWCGGNPDAPDYDCDDTDPDVHPRVEEVCNGIDDNCVDGVDEGMQDSEGMGSATRSTPSRRASLR